MVANIWLKPKSKNHLTRWLKPTAIQIKSETAPAERHIKYSKCVAPLELYIYDE